MSHFVCVVLAPQGTTLENAQETVAPLLAPYNENIEVAPYDDKCWCVREKAKNEAREAAEAKHGPFETLRSTFSERENVRERRRRMGEIYRLNRDFTDEENAELEQINNSLDADWKAHIKDYIDYEDQYFAGHEGQNAADPECDECNGTGTVKSTYNPKSKWDWWMIGGRWTGWLGQGIVGDYDPAKDPENIKTCDICYGSGMRSDPIGRMAREKDPNYTCNGCRGTGKRVEWPTQWKPSDQDAVPTRLLEGKNKVPFAVVTPDGTWHERGKMGWFASVSGKMDEGQWEAMVATLYALNPETVAIAVDCHI